MTATVSVLFVSVILENNPGTLLAVFLLLLLADLILVAVS